MSEIEGPSYDTLSSCADNEYCDCDFAEIFRPTANNGVSEPQAETDNVIRELALGFNKASQMDRDMSHSTTSRKYRQLSTGSTDSINRRFGGDTNPSTSHHYVNDSNASIVNEALLTSKVDNDSLVHRLPLLTYIYQMITNFGGTSIRAKQARLTLWEFLEHFDFLNDFVFICRVGFTTIVKSPTGGDNGKIALVCLSCIWLISGTAYFARPFIIYHRLEGDNLRLFYPFVVFSKIRDVGDKQPEVLYIFERLFWTYQLIIRVFEDLPQLICSAIFLLTFGSDLYTCFMISYSTVLLVLTSYRMGVMYPCIGTVSVLLSREPPVDSPVLSEAAPTTMYFAVFVLYSSILWLIADIICLFLGRGLWIITFTLLAAMSGFSSIICLTYFLYLLNQPAWEPTVPYPIELNRYDYNFSM